MLALLSWLAVGVAVGLTVRALAHSRRHLGIPRAVTLGVLGALLGGLCWTGLGGSGDPSGSRALAAGVASAAGAVMVPWAYLAYSIRWEPHAAGAAPDPHPVARRPGALRPGAAVAGGPVPAA